MAEEPLATRREVDILREEVRRIDDHGSRGVIGIQAQLVDLIKDFVELKAGMDERFAAHARQHTDDRAARLSGRRWLVGTGIAGIVAMAAVLTLLITIIGRLHG